MAIVGLFLTFLYLGGNIPLNVVIGALGLVPAMIIGPLNINIYWHDHQEHITVTSIIYPMLKAYFINIGSMIGGVIVSLVLQNFLPKWHSVTKLKKIGPVLGTSVLMIGGVSGVILLDGTPYYLMWELWLAAIIQPLIGAIIGILSGYVFGYIFHRTKVPQFNQEIISLALVIACQNPQYALGSTVNNQNIQESHVYPIMYALCQACELVLAVFFKKLYDWISSAFIKKEVAQEISNYYVNPGGGYIERQISFYDTPEREASREAFGLQENTGNIT